MPQSFITIDRFSPSWEDLVDKIFYGVKQDPLTSKTVFDKIKGNEPIRLPNPQALQRDDYINWMFSYNNFRFTWDEVTGRLLMEVL